MKCRIKGTMKIKILKGIRLQNMKVEVVEVHEKVC
jgi:hypothetical protein